MTAWSELPIARRIELRETLTPAQLAAYKVVWDHGGTDAEAFSAAQLIPSTVTRDEFFASYTRMVRDASPAVARADAKRRRRALKLAKTQLATT